MPLLKLEIPENCSDCSYTILRSLGDTVLYCGIFHKYIDGNKRLQDCIDAATVSIILPKQQIFPQEDATGRN